jgi:DNA-binding CsgD family transcriptional regulator
MAVQVSPAVLTRVREAEVLGTRGRAEAGLALLASTLVTLAPGADDDRIALAEMAALMTSWGADFEATTRVLEMAFSGAQTPRGRGAILLAQGRRSTDRLGTELCARALTEFTLADDLLGQAVTLGRMSFPVDDGIDRTFRLDLGRRGLNLAETSRVPWAIALCGGQLAACETYYDRPEARARWAAVADALSVESDSLAAEIAALNHANWALSALGWGDYDLAAHALNRGRVIGRGPWVPIHAAVEAFLSYRRGDLVGAAASVRVALTAHPGRRPLGAVIDAALAYEQRGALESVELSENAKAIISNDLQWGATAAAVLALTRRVRREPRPERGLDSVLNKVVALRFGFGWEDAALALAVCGPAGTHAVLESLTDLWPSNPRGQAMRLVVQGLRAGRSGRDDLVAGAEALEALGEPITAGRAFHAAARVSTSESRTRLRARALGLLQSVGADRSVAEVLRDRTLGGSRRTTIPESQRHHASAGLTPREREIALLAAEAYTAREIAARLGLSVGTVRNHLLRVREKFGNVPKRQLTRLLNDNPSN